VTATFRGLLGLFLWSAPLPLVFSGAACHRAVPPAVSKQSPAPPSTPSVPSSAVPPPAVASLETPTVAGGEPAIETDPALVAEAGDRDPRSQTVTIKLLVDAKRKAHVFWGRKDLGELPLELQRPRDSGPMDLIVSAPGFLPLHTRVFTDRDDKLFLRLFSLQEAPQMLGYASTAAANRAPEHEHPQRRSP
jgi:hypothetical protein